MNNDKTSREDEDPRRQWTAEEKLRVVLEAAQLSEDELGAFLRREGVHEAQLKEWRAAVTEAAKAALSPSGQLSATGRADGGPGSSANWR